MRFLIDECLHTSLLGIAHEAGYACDHVNFLGLSGEKDWDLLQTVRSAEYTFVTNNRTDFTTLYAGEELHAGLVILSIIREERIRYVVYEDALQAVRCRTGIRRAYVSLSAFIRVHRRPPPAYASVAFFGHFAWIASTSFCRSFSGTFCGSMPL